MTHGLGGFPFLLEVLAGAEAVLVAVGQLMVLGSNMSLQ